MEQFEQHNPFDPLGVTLPRAPGRAASGLRTQYTNSGFPVPYQGRADFADRGFDPYARSAPGALHASLPYPVQPPPGGYGRPVPMPREVYQPAYSHLDAAAFGNHDYRYERDFRSHSAGRVNTRPAAPAAREATAVGGYVTAPGTQAPAPLWRRPHPNHSTYPTYGPSAATPWRKTRPAKPAGDGNARIADFNRRRERRQRGIRGIVDNNHVRNYEKNGMKEELEYWESRPWWGEDDY